jgi:hypothetical protein
MAYFIVSWDISSSEPTWSRIDEQLRNCFKHLPYLRPVNTFYMVKVSSQQQYNLVFTALQNVAERSTQVKVRFIASPMMNITGYNGWLDQDLWPKVRQITDTPAFV